ncbi:MAG: 50S ribosomal protein L9 [Rhodospirillaceae bacterium]|nr:50S ribosomal protein L9 [Rhodospirillaceae bacterium]|tara:strand:- start:17741 stop:18346 length:606 start_codon:yes stop_codon:yes gene_type:complete
MEVILLERIEKLGQMGDVVTVRPGFARNYLLPQKKALRATQENRDYFETQRAQLEASNLELKNEADSLSKKLDGLAITIVRQASDNDQLYGSVTVRNIAQAITEAGFTVDSKQVQMARPIKTVGMHEVIVRLHPEVSVSVTANVARSEEEAIVQADSDDPIEEDQVDTAQAEDTADEQAEPAISDDDTADNETETEEKPSE